ncbi:cation-transporting P-type ATPase, partial [bacterium]|nr:cation-transporting P-type ATPase [bacterium]
MSRHGVLTKSLPSVEALGSVDVICTDKTGTLTLGQFQLEALVALSELPTEFLWKCALMSCEVRIVDSMEAAISEKGQTYQHLLTGWNLEFDYPFESHGKHMSHVWKNLDGTQVIAMKGAVEGVLEHCERSYQESAQITDQVRALTSQGKRLLGLAYRQGACTGNRQQDEIGLTFLGLLVFNDPTRESAKTAILECQKAGIEVKMLTGDHPDTAHAVADEIGMHHDHQLLFTGDELRKMEKQERWKAFQQGAIFSRVLPEQKHEMVQALKSLGKVVAMTGDGINDAPALKLADIGISMGVNATDVARSTAGMILLKND